MVPDEFLPSAKLVDMWRAGLLEMTRLSRGQIAARAVDDIPSQVLLEEIACTISSSIIGEFRHMRGNASKVLPLFGESGLWSEIAKRIDHCLPMCDKEAGQFLKILEHELQAFFLAGKVWEESWGKVCIEDGTIIVQLTANPTDRVPPVRKRILEIDL